MKPDKDTTGKRDLARKQAARKPAGWQSEQQKKQVTSNIPSAPSSFNRGAGLGAPKNVWGPSSPARGFKTKNENPLVKGPSGSEMRGSYNYNLPGKPKK